MAAILLDKHVRIEGLTARPELNGVSGDAFCFYDQKDRYGVKLASGDCVSLKSSNLVDVAGEARYDAALERIRKARDLSLEKLATALVTEAEVLHRVETATGSDVARTLADFGHACSSELVLACCTRIDELIAASGSMEPWEELVACGCASKAVRAMCDATLTMGTTKVSLVLQHLNVYSTAARRAASSYWERTPRESGRRISPRATQPRTCLA
jgi:hypothetical protein